MESVAVAHQRQIAPAVTLWTLTSLAVAVEVGLCVFSISHGLPLWQIATLLGCYHGGYLVARLLKGAHERSAGRVAAASTLCMAGAVLLANWLLLGFAVLAFSTAVQYWRRALKEGLQLPSPLKNLGKAFGMAAAAAFVLPASVIAGILAAAALALMGLATPAARRSLPRASADRSRPRILLVAELFHHAQYFAYCYLFWTRVDVSVVLVGPLFLLGWLPYFAAERWLRERVRSFSPSVFIAGHVLCVVALVSMTIFRSTPLILFMWFLTGVGGGTAYMLGNFAPQERRELFEDVGHVAGCLVGAAAVGVVASGAAATAAAAALAGAAALSMAIHASGQRSREVEA